MYVLALHMLLKPHVKSSVMSYESHELFKGVVINNIFAFVNAMFLTFQKLFNM
jgi:hypothetical protein